MKTLKRDKHIFSPAKLKLVCLTGKISSDDKKHLLTVHEWLSSCH